MTDTTTQPTSEQLLADAVRVLTAAARRTRVVGAGTPNEHSEPADFAEFVTLAVAGAAANVGGIEAVLAGRTGSWEADYVRNMLISTVGEDPAALLEHRTEPVTVTVYVDELLNDLGYWRLYDEAADELQRREDAIGIPSVTGIPGTPEYEAAVAQLQPASDAQEAQLERIDQLRDQIDQLHVVDKAAYGEAFKANLLTAAAELFPNLPVPVDAVVQLNWSNAAAEPDLGGIEWALWEKARNDTPIPSSGIALKDYPPAADIADVERTAGRDPLTRLNEGKPT